MIANHFGCLVEVALRTTQDLQPAARKGAGDALRGEPHQSAAFYREARQAEVGISSAEQLQGKALSYNNVADTDAALECVKSFDAPACVIVKHANPAVWRWRRI